MRAKSSINVLKMATILDSKRGPQNAFFLLSTGTIIATNTVQNFLDSVGEEEDVKDSNRGSR